MRRFHFVWVLVMAALAGCGDAPDPPVRSDSGLLDAGPSDTGVDADISDTPPDVTSEVSLKRPDGRACTADDQCAGGVCLNDQGWSDGYCTRPGCEQCPERCFEYGGDSFCGIRCDDLLCRDGYSCAQLPETTETICIGSLGGADGTACEHDDECYGETCHQAWPGGYCTRRGCAADSDCAPFGPRSLCVAGFGEEPMCLRVCGSNDDCREGYRCGYFAGQTLCAPPRPDERVMGDNPAIDAECILTDGSTLSFDYDVPADLISYFIVPFTIDGEYFKPVEVQLPDGASIDFTTDNDFQSQDWRYVDGFSPFMVAATDRHLRQLQSGPHRFIGSGDSEAICFYMLEKKLPGNTLDLNLYFVGVPGVDAETAPADPQFQAMLTEVDEILGAAGIDIDEVRYESVPSSVVQQFQYLRTINGVDNLVEHSRAPGETLEDALSLNVFLIRDFVGGVAGISQGIPGPAGMHGSASSGVVVAASWYADHPELLARVFAHEAGHYLGLFHTTEGNGRAHDPLDDTPKCRDFNHCTARENLMFPYVVEGRPSLSPQQGWVLRRNPLIQASRDATACGGCAELEECVDVGGTHECVCGDGLERVAGECVDVDECAVGAEACPAHSSCFNRFSFHFCECAEGFAGLSADESQCVDIDECAQSPCAQEAICENTPGSFMCTCRDGLTGDGLSCAVIDECSSGTSNCHPSTRCVNLPTGARCVCAPDYTGDPSHCDPFALQPVTLASTEQNTCGLDSTGEIVCWGAPIAAPQGTFVDIASSSLSFCAIASDATLSCWAAQSTDQLDSPAGEFAAVDLNQGASWEFACAIRLDGTMHCWGEWTTQVPTPPAGTFVDVAAGAHHVCGLRSDGTIACSGGNAPAAPAGVFTEIVAVNGGVCGLRVDGIVVCSRSPMGYGINESTDTYVALRAGRQLYGASVCAIEADGTTDCWRNGYESTLSAQFREVSIANDYGCGITTAGDAQCWGIEYGGRTMPPSNFP